MISLIQPYLNPSSAITLALNLKCLVDVLLLQDKGHLLDSADPEDAKSGGTGLRRLKAKHAAVAKADGVVSIQV